MSDAASPKSRFAVCLSGGGHRATIFSIGALLALVDRQLNTEVDVISSVSGGSITNGVVARAHDFAALEPGALDTTATSLVTKVGSRVLLSPIGLLLSFGVVDAFVLLAINGAGVHRPALLIAIGVLVLLTLLMATGELLKAGLSMLHFGVRGDATLASVGKRSVAHEFCATDLVTGMPVTFSSRGSVARRRVPVPPSQRGAAIQRWAVPRLQLAVIVRASAAFPGIAPKVVRFPREGMQAVTSLRLGGGAVIGADDLRTIALCGDGGIWNNLGTQAIREEGEEQGLPALCANASAPAKTSPPWWFFVPGVSLAFSMFRTMTILNRNTVEPRVDAVNRDLDRRADEGTPPDARDPLTVISDMRPVLAMRSAMSRWVHPEPDKGGAAGRSHVTPNELERLGATAWWQALVALDTGEDIRTSTRLTRVPPAEALPLLVRGYANTWLASLMIKPLEDTDLIDRQIATRIERMTGGKP